jgi:1,6-anhydro-N-acetylmuramate kinase
VKELLGEHEKLDWGLHGQKLLHEDRFHIPYHMPLEDFEVLVELLRNDIAPNFRQSNRRCKESIYTKMIVAVLGIPV